MTLKRASILLGSCWIIFVMSSCQMKATLNEQALHTLKTTLKEQSEFVKAHAAEYLLGIGDTAEARKAFLTENDLHASTPRYRIVIWRVLAETENTPEGKRKWTDKILHVFGDLQAPDRLHASETLARLGISPLERLPEATRASLASDNPNLRVYTRWAISFSSDSILADSKRKFLDFAASDSLLDIRKISAYILRHMKGLTPVEWSALATGALAEDTGSGFRQNYLNTAYVTFPGAGADTTLYGRVKAGILQGDRYFSAEDRIGLAQALAEKGTSASIPVLISYLKNENVHGLYEPSTSVGADVRAAAAFAILKINRRDQ